MHVRRSADAKDEGNAMGNVKGLITSFRYGGLSRSELDMCVPDVRKANIATLNWVLPAMGSVLVVLFIVSLVPGTGEEPNRYLYATFALAFLVEFLFHRLYFSRHPEKISIMVHIFMVIAYLFGIYEATFLGEDASSVVFCILIIAVPLLIYELPARIAIISLATEAILLVVYFAVGNEEGDPFVVLNSLASTLLSVCCGYVIQKTKFSDIRNHIMLQIQHDTDMMTGAFSRAAYINDLSEMDEDRPSAGIIFADVNGLKKANDTCGHEAGDRLIKNAYSALTKYFNGVNDRIYRIGGDEFVIVSRTDDKEEFERRFRELADSVNGSGIISCGCVWQAEIEDTEDAVKAAEKMMYSEKNRYYREHPEKDRRTR